MIHLNDNSEDPRFDLMREEVLASHLMKELTHKYGTKGKSAKFIFMQAFQEGQRPDAKGLFAKLSRPQALTCEEEESQAHGFMDDFETDWEDGAGAPSRDDLFGNAAMSQITSRPAAMVTQSNFVSRLEEQVKMEVMRAGCPSPHFELSWLYEQIRREGPKVTATGTAIGDAYETYSIRDGLDEPEEKMVARLKIYRRAFSALILHFEALRPILKDIKRNYDNMLAFREQQVSEATKVKKNIHHLELSLDDKMATVRFEGFKQLADLEKQCFLLMRHVDRQDLAMRTMTDILNKLETSLSEEHDMRRDSEDQRKLLIVEINELRRKLGMAPRPTNDVTANIRIEDEEEEAAEVDVITTEDPIILRRALEITRNNLSEAHHRLTILEVDYADVIPRHEFEDLKLVMTGMEAEHAQMTETYNNVHSEVEGLRAQIEKLTGSRNNLQELVGDLRKRATPRPSWEKIADHIDGGFPKWKSLIDGKSSAEIVPTLIQELTGKKLGPPEFIPALGIGPEVPLYLRWDSQIRRRNFSRRDALLVIQDIWQIRSERLEALRRYNEAKEEEASGSYGSTALTDIPEEMPVILPFPDFFMEYFVNRFHIPAMRMEWIYNVFETCTKLGPIEPKLSQFLDILEGHRDEGVYHLFRAQVAKLRNAVISKSDETGQSPGSIQFGHFGQVLRRAFAEKTDEEIKRLMAAASRQTGIHADFSIVKYIAFFAMTDEGLIGAFVEEFAKQFEEDRLKYVYEVLMEVLGDLGVSLSSAERENDPAGETDVSMQQVFSAFVTVDSTMPDDKLGAAMMWIFLGNSMLPGALPRGLRLVEFLRQHLRLSEFHEDEAPPNDDDDDEFERAVSDILSEKEAEELNEMTGKGRRKWLQKKRVTNLGTIVRRLKGGAFLRHGPRYASNPSGDPTEEEGRDHVHIEGEVTPDGAVDGAVPTSRKVRKESARKQSAETKEKDKEAVRVESAPAAKAPAAKASASKITSAAAVKSKTAAGKKDKKKKKAK